MSQADDLRASLEVRTTEELVRILRNRDESEWRPEVFALVAAILAARGMSPASASSLGPGGQDVLEDQPLATLARFFSPPGTTSAAAVGTVGLPRTISEETGPRRAMFRSSVALALVLATPAVAAEKTGSQADVKSACGWSALWSPVDLAPGAKLVPPRKTRDVPVQWPQDPLGASSRRRGKGAPIAELVIDRQGRVADARLVRRATWEPPWPEAEAALLEAVRQWEFQPATVSGEAVQACLTVSIDIHWR